MANITGEKLHLNHLLHALRTAARRYGVPLDRFRAVPNHEKLRYEILLNVGAAVQTAFMRDTLLPCIDQSLSDANVEYASKRESRRLKPPCIHVMDSSWMADVRDHAAHAARGSSQFKWRPVAAEVSDVDARHIQYTVEAEER
jgi:hypothetical protein